MNIENIEERLLRTERERDEAREEVSQLHMRAASWPGYNIEAAKAEIASLRASQNERAIAELAWVASMMRGGAFDPAWTKARVDIDARIAALRAEQAAAPAPVTPPADAPQMTRIEELRSISCSLGEDHGDYDAESIERIRDAVRLLLDDALAARGGEVR